MPFSWSCNYFQWAALVLVAPAFGVQAQSGAPSTASAPTSSSRGEAVRAKLEAIRAKTKVPALAGAIVTSEGLEAVWAAGVRAAGKEVPVATSDSWHLGSCTKSMTATLIALLVERGDLQWDKQLVAYFPELASEIDKGYADLTLVELLAHRAGMPAMTAPDSHMREVSAFRGTVTEQRAELVRRILTAPPVTLPRKELVYSNAGPIVAGHIAERVTKKTWEELMRELLFVPLCMTTASFGAPGTRGRLEQPKGHDESSIPVEPGPYADNPAWIGPAGTCCMSLADWGKYAALHLRGAIGDVKVGAITLPSAAMTRLHTAYAGAGAPYGFGWSLPKRSWARGDHTVLSHTVSNGRWFSACWLDPASGIGVLTATNVGGEAGSKATDQAAAVLLQELLDREKDREKEREKSTKSKR